MDDFIEHEKVLWKYASRTLLILCILTFLMVIFSAVSHGVGTRTMAYAQSEAPSVQAVDSPALPTYKSLDAAPASTSTARILFVGDMFFDRQIRFVSDTQGSDYPFSCIDRLLRSADMVVGNLEGPITTSKSVSFGTVPGSPNNYRFTFATTTAATLLQHNIQAVTLGNNHILNFGMAGLLSTHAFLDDAGVGYFGGIAGNEPVYRRDIAGVPLSFVGYNQFGGSSPGDVANTIRYEKSQGRVVIVFSHWGVEYSTNASTIRSIATLFAVNGAAAVLGAHPHVVGEHETIGKTVVYYSLGNFIFDQYFSLAVMHGLAVAITFSKDGVASVEEFPTELERDGRTCQAS